MGRKEEALRLHEMMLATGLRKSKFANKLGITPQSLNDYFDCVSDLKHLSRKVFRNGFSVDWLYSGKGNMFFSKKRFEEKFELPSSFDIDLQKQRILEWIKTNYGSIQNFASERQIKEELIDCLYNNDIISHELLVKLENSGCNLKWTIDQSEPMFKNNIIGKKLMKGKK